jgi:transposase, IS5 family
MMETFFDLGIEKHLDPNSYLMKLEKLINWDRLAKKIQGIHSDFGPEGYSPLQMFKCLLLKEWHHLSDPELEASLRVRIDFLHFTGFSIGGDIPDETTFCRFRNKLINQGKLEQLFNEVNKQLEESEIKVKKAPAAIVDATIIESAARPRKVVEVTQEGEVNTQYSADSDARWLQKGKKSHFGYQAFARSDEEGFIDKTHVTPANAAETKELDRMTEGLEAGVRVKADKGFFSRSNKEMLKSKSLKNGLMYRAFRNTSISKRMKQFNKLISRTRWRIEQCFGTIKRRFHYQRASYFSVERVHAQFMMKAMCHNLLKAINKIQIA